MRSQAKHTVTARIVWEFVRPDDTIAPPSRDDVRRQLVLDECNTVAQYELAFFQALNLDNIRARNGLQRFDRGVEVAMLLPQPLELCPQLDFLFFGHSQPPNPNALSRPEHVWPLTRTPEILPTKYHEWPRDAAPDACSNIEMPTRGLDFGPICDI